MIQRDLGMTHGDLSSAEAQATADGDSVGVEGSNCRGGNKHSEFERLNFTSTNLLLFMQDLLQ